MSKKNKIVLIICIVLVVLTLAGAIAFVIYNYNNNSGNNTEEEVKLKEDWEKSYYEYLKDEEEIVPSKAKNTTLSFIELEKDNTPIMLIQYVLNKKTYSNIYFINDNDDVKKINYDESSDIKVLYSLEGEYIAYYIELNNNDEYTYLPILTLIKNYNNGDKNTPDFKVSHKKETIKNDNGNKIEISEFEKTFIEFERPEAEEIDLKDIKKNELKNIIKDLGKEFESIKDYNKKDIEDEIDNAKDKIKKMKEIIEEQEEIEEQRKKEEEEKRLEEEKKKEEEEKKKNEATTTNNIYNLVKGYYCYIKEGEYECIHIYKKNNKGYCDSFVPSSEFFNTSEIKSITEDKNKVFSLKLSSTTIKIDATNSSKYILVNGKKFQYVTNNYEDVSASIFGW